MARWNEDETPPLQGQNDVDHVHSTTFSVQTSNQVLRNQGYRLTPQRHLILLILQQAEHHLTIEQIQERAHEHYPHLNLSTIYRTLDLLKDLQLVRQTYFPDGQIRYEAWTGRTHHHLVCQHCGAVVHLDEVLQKEIQALLEQHYHFHSLQTDVMSTGICQECWKEQPVNSTATP